MVFTSHAYDQLKQVFLRFALQVLATLKANLVFSQLAQAKEIQAMLTESFSDVMRQIFAALLCR